MEIVYVKAIISLLQQGRSREALLIALYLGALMEGNDISIHDMEEVGKILQTIVNERNI